MAPRGTGTRKRKLGRRGAPDATAPPSKRGPSRRKLPKATDVYEAEDSDPDELKNTKRYDQVENYEYELPSDFEDEEIDEELAFTAEDNAKYGGWFDDDDDGAAPGSEDGEQGPNGVEDEPEDQDGGGEDRDVHNPELDILYSSDEESGGRRERLRAAVAVRKQLRAANNDDDNSEGEVDEDEGQEGSSESGDVSSDEEGEANTADDDALALFDQFGDSGDEDGEEGGLESDEDDEGEQGTAGDEDLRHRSMLTAALGLDDGVRGAAGVTRHGLAALRQSVINEAYPEAEFALGMDAASAGAGGELTLGDLLAGLGGDGRKKLPAPVHRELQRISGAGKTKVVSAPVPRAIRERTERQAGYEMTSKDVTKWQPLVKANREAPTLQFTTGREEVPRVNTTSALVAQHTPATAMEQEVAALLNAAGAATATAVAAAEEALAVKALSLDEAKARRERLARLRALLFYHELKAKRLKKIKSKEYHRKAAKTKRKGGRALLEDADDMDAERAALEQAEFERAKERLTLKHRNTSRWARRALKRGATLTDDGTRAAVAEQLRLGEALRRRIEGGKAHSSEDDDDGGVSGSDVDASDGEEGAAAATANDVAKPGALGLSKRAKALALDILAGSDPAAAGDQSLPSKGLFALPFMARAMERKKQAAMQEAAALLRGAEPDGANTVSTSARRMFGAGSGAAGSAAGATPEDEGAGGSDSDEREDAEAKAERLKKVLAGEVIATPQRASKPPPRRQPTAAEEADLDAALAGVPGQLNATAAPPARLLPGSDPAVTAGGALAHGGAFIPATAFQGARPGHVFKKGKQGLGYYPDHSPAQPTGPQPPVTARGRRRGGRGAGNADGTANSAALQPGAVAGPQQAGSTQGGTARPPAAKQPDPNGASTKRRVATDADAAAGAQPGSGSDSEGSDGSRLADGGSAPGEGMRPAPGDRAAAQRELVAMAFAADDVEADFAADKAAQVAAQLPQVDEPSGLPGWGAWASQQREPKWMRDARAKAAREKAKAAAGRKDAGLQFVVLSERYDRKAMDRYAAPAVPFPFDSRETYEASIRQPLGKQFNPDASFRDLTRPAVLKTTGAVINPIRYSKPLAKHAAEVVQHAARPAVLTVSGGVFKRPKQQGKA